MKGWRRPGPRAEDARGEVRAEIEAHFEGTVDLLMQRGWSREAAVEEARRRFGNVDRYVSDLERIGRWRHARERLRAASGAVNQSLQAALRDLRRSPGFSAAVVVTLALGIGANAAVFGVVDRLLLSPPSGIERPSEVRRLHQTYARESGEPNTIDAFTYPDVVALRSSALPGRVGAFIAVMPETLGEGEGALRVRVARADSAFLPLLGVTPALGRGFVSGDHRPGAPPVALLAHALWADRFAADPAVLGTTLRLGPGAYEVVGVLPPGFRGAVAPATDVWLPLEASAEERWGSDWHTLQNLVGFSILARMEPGTRPEDFAGEVAPILRRSRSDYGIPGELLHASTTSLVPGDEPDPSEVVAISRWLAGVSLLVLLVACANVANLFLARGERVRRETGLRRAIGAPSARIRAELLVRALLLALLGGAAALALASWGGSALEDLFLIDLELPARQGAGRALVHAAAAAVLAATLSGLLPALHAPGTDLRACLESGGRATATRGRLRRSLVGFQAALSAVLLVGAALFVLSLRAAIETELGFDHERLIMARIERESEAEADVSALYREAEEALRALPEVSSVTRSVAIPFVLLYGLTGRLPGEAPDGQPRLRVNGVGVDFFTTMGVPLLRGRGIEARDLVDGAEPVAVVGPTAAADLWPGEDPLGKCLLVGTGEPPCATVVGVAAEHAGTSLSLRSIGERPERMAWVPLTHPGVRATPGLLVRAEGDIGQTAVAVRSRILGVGGVRYAEVTPMSEFVGRQMRTWRIGALVFSLFGLIAPAVAAVGLYGVLAYDVTQRQREIGIRIALGASRGAVVGRVLLGALATIGVGVAAGLLFSAWGARWLEALLFEVSPREPAVFALAAGALALITLAAAALPAWRAARVDPRESLAAE